MFTSEWPREPLDGADTIGVNPKPCRERRRVVNDPGVWNVLKQPYGVAQAPLTSAATLHRSRTRGSSASDLPFLSRSPEDAPARVELWLDQLLATATTLSDHCRRTRPIPRLVTAATRSRGVLSRERQRIELGLRMQ